MGRVLENIISTIKEHNLTSKYSVFDSMIEGVQVIGYEWEYIYVNESIAKQGLTTKDKLIGSTMLKEYPGFEHSEIFKFLQICMHQRIASETTTEFDFPDGSKGWFEVSVQPVPEGILVLSSDITKLKRAEAKLKKKLTERTLMIAQISKQKKQLEEFCQIIAHNLRSPLTNLIQLNEMIQESNDNDEKTHYIKFQKDVIDLLHKTFEELVTSTQVRMDQTIKRSKLNLEKYTEKAINTLNEQIVKTNTEITYDFSEINKIEYSKKYFENILINLIGNAIKYHSPDRTPKVHIKSYTKKGWIYVDVSDNGLGIDMKKNGDDLFKLHKTFHNHTQAKGFGLFITKTQIEAMGGSISAESKPNEGSVFTIKLYKAATDGKN
ncbi:MAG: PAS domain-containing sensor histidine kinase [Bacteroidota bacterium]